MARVNVGGTVRILPFVEADLEILRDEWRAASPHAPYRAPLLASQPVPPAGA